MLVCNRIKPHTDFRGRVESGLCKMLAIGLAKHAGCSRLHREGFPKFGELLPEVAAKVLERTKVGFGTSIVENAYDETAHVEAVPATDFLRRDAELLVQAKRLMARIMLPAIDVLVVERIGKDVSGAGMDPNIMGRTVKGPLQGYDGPEIKRIVEMGIEVRTKTRVGRDIPVEEVEKTYDAILWALGCQSGRGLPVPGWEGTPNCVSGVAFLKAFNEGRMKVTASKVVCVGGGDTSIDVVSVARRIGHIEHTNPGQLPESVLQDGYIAHDSAVTAARQGAHVTLTSLFAKSQMTAAEHEVHDALTEGVTILDEVMPVEVVKGADGRATALKICRCTLDKGRPIPIPGTEQLLEADLIVSAIGQGGDLSGLEQFDNGRGLINSDAFYQVPGKPGHFVAGDIIRPHLLTTAIGQAAIAVDSINEFLNKQDHKKRPKVDVHHFDLMSKLQETGLQPAEFNVEERGDLRQQVDEVVRRAAAREPELLAEQARVEQGLERARRFKRGVELAVTTIQEVAQETHKRWAEFLTRRVGELLAGMGSQVENVRFGDDLDFSLGLPGGQRVTRGKALLQLSAGARDQLHLAVRLGLSEFLSKPGDPLPLLCDDVFANSDDERARAGMRLLVEQLAREHQVIVMTCHRHRHEHLAGLDPDVWAAGVQWLELRSAESRTP